MSTKRTEVYAAIDTERAYQDARWPQNGQPGFPNPLTIGEFVLLLEQYAAEARAEWAREKRPEMRTLNIVRKIAGIAVNCMEQHGAPHRASTRGTEALPPPDTAWQIGKTEIVIRIVGLLERHLVDARTLESIERDNIKWLIEEYKTGRATYEFSYAEHLSDEDLLRDVLLLIDAVGV